MGLKSSRKLDDERSPATAVYSRPLAVPDQRHPSSSMSPLLPIAGTAALSLARETVGAIGSGLSFATELLRQDNDAARAASEPAPIDLPPSAAQERFEQALADFVARLRQRLAILGIDVGDPLALESDGLGGIQVDGERPDRAAIEQSLAGDPQLLAEFQKLAEQYAALMGGDDRLGDFGLLIGEDCVEVVCR